MSSVARICSVEGCEGRVQARGWCGTHYSRVRRGIPLDAPVRKPQKNKGLTCSWETCEAPAYAQVLCKMHYTRRREGKDMDAPKKKPVPDTCTAPECSNKYYGRGYCRDHYPLSLTPKTPEGSSSSGGDECTVPGCAERVKYALLCEGHYRQSRKYRIPRERLIALVADRTCMSCGEEVDRMVIDHDHSCCPGDTSCGDCVRGALCTGCNVGLGYFRESPAKLRGAIEYLRKNGIVE